MAKVDSQVQAIRVTTIFIDHLSGNAGALVDKCHFGLLACMNLADEQSFKLSNEAWYEIFKLCKITPQEFLEQTNGDDLMSSTYLRFREWLKKN